jgi:DNA end-binding protein Ku
MAGGMAQTETWDPKKYTPFKPGVPTAQVLSTFPSIRTTVDLAAIAPETASAMEIVQFVKEAEVDPLYFERSYYVAPGEEVTKPYALFLKALEDSGHYAIAKLAMHNREHVVLIRPDREGLVLHTLFYPDELHVSNRQKIPAKAEASKKELELASQLIKQLSAPFKPDQFHDTYRDNVEKLIEQKENGERVAKHPAKAHKAKVVDLMDALRKSLAEQEKTKPIPAASKRVRRRKAA